MIASTVWNNLVSTLQNNPGLSYIKQVYEGRRWDIEPESLPCIQIEPVQDGEIEKDTSNVQDIYFTVNIFAFSSANFNEFPKTIVGGQDYKGIVDINNDIRACLIASYDLGGTVIDTRVQTSIFDQVEEKYPTRGLLIPVKILYRQQNGV